MRISPIISDRTAHLLMGILFLVVFCLVGLAMLVQPHDDVVALLSKAGIAHKILACYFIVAGVMNGIAGFRYESFNPLWFAPMILYAAATWGAWVQSNGSTSVVPALMYTLLCGMYLIDYITESAAEVRITKFGGQDT